MPELARGEASGRHIVLFAADCVQSRVLAEVIADHLDCTCHLAPVDPLPTAAAGPHDLALLDVDLGGTSDVAAQLRLLAECAGGCPVALVNVDEAVSVEQVAGWPGIKGVFFRCASRDNLLNGIRTILRGECWLPRKVLAARWDQPTLRRPPRPVAAVRLSPKELETLLLLTGGDSNERIARKLHVSRHTVKSHVYSLFRKLQVSNRVQAAQWALQHVEGVESGWRYRGSDRAAG